MNGNYLFSLFFEPMIYNVENVVLNFYNNIFIISYEDSVFSSLTI